jgi:hypothetical protein
MFKLSFILLVLAFLLTNPLLAQTPPKEGTATITGRVSLKGEPAPGVAIGLQQQQQASGPFVADRSKYLRAKTDGEGRFRFMNVTAGQYRIVALAPGFVSASESPQEMGKLMNVADGENIENVELQLRRGAVITGRITDPSGNPVIEKDVRLMKMDGRGNFTRYYSGSSGLTSTDDRGVYRIHSLPAGKYKVGFGYDPQDGSFYEMSRVYYPHTFHPDTRDEAQAKVIELSDGAEATDVDIKLAEAKKNYEVAGRVIEAETGQPVVGIRIGYGTVQSGGMSGRVSGMSATDTQGEYQIQGVLPGKYLAFADSRFDPKGSDYYSDQTPFEITDGDITGIEIRVHRGGSISGIAVVEGSNDPAILSQLSKINLTLSYRSSDQTANRNARPAANGSFRFSGLKPGKAEVRAFTPPDGLKLLRVEHNGAPVTEGIEIQPGENLANLRVVFGYGTAVVRGQVKFTGGAMPEGVTMYLGSRLVGGAASGGFTSPVDARGQFVLKNLVAGEYELKLFLGFNGPPPPEMSKLMKLLQKTTHRVTVAGSGETPTEFVVDLSQKENDK